MSGIKRQLQHKVGEDVSFVTTLPRTSTYSKWRTRCLGWTQHGLCSNSFALTYRRMYVIPEFRGCSLKYNSPQTDAIHLWNNEQIVIVLARSMLRSSIQQLFKVSWCKSIKAFVGKKKDFEFTCLFDWKPVMCNESWSDVFILAS